MKFLKNKGGYKIVEVLLVVTVTGASITLSSTMLNSARAKNRDTQRVTEIDKIQSALEMYYLDHASYPDGDNIILGKDNGSCLNFSGWQTTGCSEPYIDAIKPDPDSESTGYVYSNDGQHSYEIVFELEKGVNRLSAGTCRAVPGPKISCL